VKVRVVSFLSGDFEVDYLDYQGLDTLKACVEKHQDTDPDIFVQSGHVESKYDGTTILVHTTDTDVMEFTEVTQEINITIIS
jgi:hypothetical protein